MKKSIQELIDELSIVNCKLFYLMDHEANLESLSKIKKLNKYRSELKNAIGEYFNEEGEIKV